MSLQKVAVVGASGNIGSPTVHLLHEAGFEITAITRENSSSTFPPYVKVKPIDYASVSALEDAFRGIDVVISCLGYFALDIQPNLVEAAAKAGVKRFFPAEYGADLLNPKTREFPVLASKLQVQDLLKVKARETGMTYSLIFTGLFLDWGLDTGMVVNVKEGICKIYDGGDRPVSFSTTTTVAKAIVGCLKHPDETKDRGVYVQDVITSQNHIIELAKEVRPNQDWKLEQLDTAVLEKQAHEAFLRQDYANMSGSVFRMYFGGKDYGMPFSRVDNELFGIKEMDDGELKQVIKTIMEK